MMAAPSAGRRNRRLWLFSSWSVGVCGKRATLMHGLCGFGLSSRRTSGTQLQHLKCTHRDRSADLDEKALDRVWLAGSLLGENLAKLVGGVHHSKLLDARTALCSACLTVGCCYETGTREHVRLLPCEALPEPGMTRPEGVEPTAPVARQRIGCDRSAAYGVATTAVACGAFDAGVDQ